MNDLERKIPPLAGQPAAASSQARLDSDSLFAGKNELIIVHQGEEYRLRITRQRKLILTK